MKKLLSLLIFVAAFAIAQAAPNPFFNSAVTNSSVLVKAAPSGGQVFLWSVNVSNSANTAAGAFIQFFDAATAGAVTPGTTAPLFVLSIPPGGVIDKDLVKAIPFYKGIVICITTTSTGGSALSSACPSTLFYE